ncbi:glycosyltransferase [Roseobacter sp. HKCCD5988]|uniref:glycosyltransferase n=1 Tax=Roseobacter sp. HKCCD5988 TaxID=3120338 RepID=UPI0030EC4801
MTLSEAFHERGIDQQFAIRPGRLWRHEVEGLGGILEGRFLRRTPRGLFDLWRLHRAIRDFQPDAIMAWRAPAARLIPRDVPAAKIVRLGDYPHHVRHFAGLDAVVCNNPSIARHIRELGWGGKAPIISNFSRPVSSVPISRAELDTPDDAFVVCGAGRFTRVKGFDLLIAAVAQLEGVYLWLVGDGPEAEALLWQAEDLGVSDRVRFAGWRENPTEVIGAADAFVLPSRDEPLGNALIEAWRVGVPSVASMTDGPNWYAEDGRDALLVPVGDVSALAGALRRLVADGDLRGRLVAGASQTLSERFDRDAVVDAYLELFDRINVGRK